MASLSVSAADYLVTLAGSALASGDTDAVGRQARFSDPAGIVFDHQGNLYVADNRNHTIRRIAPSGEVITFAGKAGVPGATDGLGATARFDSPTGLAVDSENNLFVADTGNHLIRKITATGMVSTWAGRAGQSGTTNGTRAQARFSEPLALTIGASNELYVTDSGNHTVRKISADGQVTTLAGRPRVWGSTDGPGTAARFHNPVGIARDQQGNLYVSDANNFTIRKIAADGQVTTLAGSAGQDGCVDALGAAARFCQTAELISDPHGCLFVADSFNHVIRKVEPSGRVSTIAGLPGQEGQANGPTSLARLFNPYGLALDVHGNLFISDAYNQTVRLMLIPFSVALVRSNQGALLTLSWETVLGQRYQVQYREQAGTGAWQDLGTPVAAVGTTTTQTDSGAEPGQRYYRVMRVERE